MSSDFDYLIGRIMGICSKMPVGKYSFYITPDKKNMASKFFIKYYFNEKDYEDNFIRSHNDIEIYYGKYIGKSESFRSDLKYITGEKNLRVYKNMMYIFIWETDDWGSGIYYPVACLMLRFNNRGMITSVKRINSELSGDRPLLEYINSRAVIKDEIAQEAVVIIRDMIRRIISNRYMTIVKDNGKVFHERYKYKEKKENA